MFQHHKNESVTHGGSPGNGMTAQPFSQAPLATEGEATPGPDDWNPYEEQEYRDYRRELEGNMKRRKPTKGNDPFAFDDVEGEVTKLEMPGIDRDYFSFPDGF